MFERILRVCVEEYIKLLCIVRGEDWIHVSIYSYFA